MSSIIKDISSACRPLVGAVALLVLMSGCEGAPAVSTPKRRAAKAAPSAKGKRSPGARRACPPCPRRPPLFPRLYKPVEYVVDFYGMKYAGNSGNLIDRRILFWGAFEKDVLHFMRDALKALGRKDAVFVDVGANTGQHTLFMSKHAGRIIAVEPLPSILARLRRNLQLNKLSQVTVLPVGFGDKPAELPFYKPPKRNLGSGSFVKRFQPGNTPHGKLKVVRGDEALRKAGVTRVDLLKIDVEGYEKPVLRGLRSTLAKQRPLVVMELTIDPRHKAVFKSAEELRAAFPKGYAFFAMVRTTRGAATGRYKLRPYDFDFTRLGQRELICVPQKLAAKLPPSGG